MRYESLISNNFEFMTKVKCLSIDYNDNNNNNDAQIGQFVTASKHLSLSFKQSMYCYLLKHLFKLNKYSVRHFNHSQRNKISYTKP